MGQVAKDFDLTETAVLERVKQAGRDTETRSDGGLTSTERQELTELRRGNRRLRQNRGDPQAGRGFLRVKQTRWPSTHFIEAEKGDRAPRPR